MAVKYGFFNSVNGDRLYNANDISRFFYKLISDGVLDSPATNLMVVAGSGMTIKVLDGYGMINAKYVWLTSDESVTLDAADIALPRIDRVVLRLDTDNRQIVVAAKKGTPAASPTPPALTRSGAIYELSLAKIAVAANATAISQADITDERPDESVCGYIVGLLQQIDTSGLFAQFTDAFNTWFAGLQDQVFRNTLVRRYTSRTLASASQQVFSIGIPEYNASTDILNVYVNGFRMIPAVDYTINPSASSITLTSALDVNDTPVMFEVLKSIDGSPAESTVQLVYAMQQRLGGLSFRKMLQSEYDALSAKDESTVYYVVSSDGVKQYLGSIQLTSGSDMIFDRFAPIYDNALTGTVETYEEVSNGD